MTVDDLRDEINKGYPILGGEDAVISRCYKIMSERIEWLEDKVSTLQLENCKGSSVLDDKDKRIKELEAKVVIAEELISDLESDLNRSVAEVHGLESLMETLQINRGR